MKEETRFGEPEENRKKEPKQRLVGERSLWGVVVWGSLAG